jgi:hypothetical protein
MDRLSAPQQNRLLAGLSNLLRRVEQDSGPEFLPRGLDVMGLVRQLALPSAETVEKMSYGDPLFRMPTQSNIPITTDKGYLAEVLGMLPAVPAASRATTRLSNEAADALVRQITGNQQATAQGALQAAGEMAPLSRMFKPEQVKSVLPETKIVDESGNPKLMYHGTREDFEQFDPGTRGAVFASPDPKFTNVYAGEDMDRYLSGGNVRPVFVNAKNPFDYDNPDHVQAVVQYIKKNDPDFADIADGVGEKVRTGVYSQIERPLVQNAIRQLGFDGFFVQERGIKNIAVFEPEQIKSAVSDPAFTGLLEPQAGAKGFNVVQPGDKVSGLTVREDVPNMSSISASLDDYEILSGIREVPRSAFDEEYLGSLSYENLDKRTKDLAEQIKQSKEINPMIVGVDSKGAYIIEGGHRFDALMSQDTKSIPAVVVIDKSDPPSDISSLLD